MKLTLAGVLLLGLPTFFLLGLGCSKSATTPFVQAKITIYYPLEGLKPTTRIINDSKEVNELASFFPHLGEGQSSSSAAGWDALGTIEFSRSTGEVVKVMFDSFEFWSEGRGDWRLPDEFKPYFLKLMKGTEQVTNPGNQESPAAAPSDK